MRGAEQRMRDGGAIHDGAGDGEPGERGGRDRIADPTAIGIGIACSAPCELGVDRAGAIDDPHEAAVALLVDRAVHPRNVSVFGHG